MGNMMGSRLFGLACALDWSCWCEAAIRSVDRGVRMGMMECADGITGEECPLVPIGGRMVI